MHSMQYGEELVGYSNNSDAHINGEKELEQFPDEAFVEQVSGGNFVYKLCKILISSATTAVLLLLLASTDMLHADYYSRFENGFLAVSFVFAFVTVTSVIALTFNRASLFWATLGLVFGFALGGNPTQEINGLLAPSPVARADRMLARRLAKTRIVETVSAVGQAKVAEKSADRFPTYTVVSRINKPWYAPTSNLYSPAEDLPIDVEDLPLEQGEIVTIDTTIDPFVAMRNPLMNAAVSCDVEKARELLADAALQIDGENVNGETALHWAAKGNCLPVAKLLLDSGANTAHRAINGYTPLVVAHNYRAVDVWALLAGMTTY